MSKFLGEQEDEYLTSQAKRRLDEKLGKNTELIKSLMCDKAAIMKITAVQSDGEAYIELHVIDND